jgi:alanyl aminopeptidase
VGPFEFVDIPGMSIPGRVVTPRGQSALAKTAVETTPPLLAFLEEYFGQPYPFAKLDLIATHQSFSGAMEHPGAITYSDFLLLLDDTASQRQKAGLMRVTAHELAHQWFGNLVTMQWWDDLWLNESFADWMGDKTMQAVYPDAGGSLQQLRTTFQVMDTDARATTKPIRHNFKSTDNFQQGIFLSYYKGKSVINMFEGAIGEQKFRDGVVRYIRKYSRGNAAAGDFWKAFDLEADFDFSGALASFIDAAGIPLISVAADGDGKFTFSQSRFVAGGEDLEDPNWIIPVLYKYRSGSEVLEGKLLLDGPAKTIDLGEDVAWILPNSEQQGYYRWQLPDAMLVTLASKASEHLKVRERMGLVSNLWSLLSAGALAGDSFVSSIQGLSSDTHPSVLAALTDQLDNIQDTFITEELTAEFATYVRSVLKPTLHRLTAADIQGESAEQASLRPEVIDWLADAGADKEARAHVDNYAEKFLTEEIPASALVNMSLRNLAARGDQALYEKYVSLLETAATPGERQRYLSALGSFRDPAIIDQILDYVLSNPLAPNDVTTIIANLIAPNESKPQLLDWLMANDTALRERLPDTTMAVIPFFVLACSEEPLETVQSFYGDKSRLVAGVENSLLQSGARTRNCVQLKEREQAAVAEYLGSLKEG